jgi:hypothetical protein
MRDVPAAAFRRFMLGLAAVICGGTLLELALIGHAEAPIQFLAYGLNMVGLGVTVRALWRPSGQSIAWLRRTMPLLVIGACLGVAQHYLGNLAFEKELHPDVAGPSLAFEAARGATPILAPGILALAGLLGLASAYRHPLTPPTEGGTSPAH